MVCRFPFPYRWRAEVSRLSWHIFRGFFHTGFSLIFCLLQTYADSYTLRKFYRIQTFPKNVIQCKKLELTGKGRGGPLVGQISELQNHSSLLLQYKVYTYYIPIFDKTLLSKQSALLAVLVHPRSIITFNLFDFATWNLNFLIVAFPCMKRNEQQIMIIGFLRSSHN